MSLPEIFTAVEATKTAFDIAKGLMAKGALDTAELLLSEFGPDPRDHEIKNLIDRINADGVVLWVNQAIRTQAGLQISDCPGCGHHIPASPNHILSESVQDFYSF